MRKIQFRAWSNYEKLMLSWVCICQTAFNRGEVSLMHKILTGSTEDEHGFVTMQFTGLQDKNGKDIYEGDILQGFRPSDEWISEKHWIGKVKWASVRCAFVVEIGTVNVTYKDLTSTDETHMVDKSTGIDYYHTVIGNVFENPELLK